MSSSASSSEQRPSGRSFLIDLLKAGACLLIVVHHLAFYGPMSEALPVAWRGTVGWFSEHGRLAVQVFLVSAGFLTARSLARLEKLDWPGLLKMAWQRYLRLAIALMTALSLTVLVTEFIRPEFDHPMLSATPQWAQVVAHIALAQHLLDFEALSAGVWYVAIDFQLYLMALFIWLLAEVCRAAHAAVDVQTLRWGMCLTLTCASLWWWNLDTDLDNHGIYFFGTYGLGMLAWEARHRAIGDGSPASRQRGLAVILLLLMGAVGWWLMPRSRLATACTVAFLLISLPAGWLSTSTTPLLGFRRAVHWLSAVSYAVFLIHFSVIVLVSAWINAFWPTDPWVNVLGIFAAMLLSVGAGAVLHFTVERQPPSVWRWGFWVGVFLLSVAISKWMNATA